MSKLILSLFNYHCAFALPECLRQLDNSNLIIANRIVQHYLQNGEDEFLLEAGREVAELNPIIWEAGNERYKP